MEIVNFRKPNLFEYLLLVVVVISLVTGFLYVKNVIDNYGPKSFEATTSILLSFSLMVLLVIAAVQENAKEVVKAITLNQHEEIKLLRQDLRRKR